MEKTVEQFIIDHKAWLDGDIKDKPKGRDYNLMGGNLSNEFLPYADLSACDLLYTKFNETCLYGASMEGSDINAFTIFEMADLREIDFSQVSFSGSRDSVFAEKKIRKQTSFKNEDKSKIEKWDRMLRRQEELFNELEYMEDKVNERYTFLLRQYEFLKLRHTEVMETLNNYLDQDDYINYKQTFKDYINLESNIKYIVSQIGIIDSRDDLVKFWFGEEQVNNNLSTSSTQIVNNQTPSNSKISKVADAAIIAASVADVVLDNKMLKLLK